MIKRKKIILLDDDNVQNKWDSPSNGLRRFIEDELGLSFISEKEKTNWDYAKLYGVEHNKKIHDFLMNPPVGYYRDLDPMPGAIETTLRLIDEFERVIVITTPIYDPHHTLKRDKVFGDRWHHIVGEKQERLYNWYGEKMPLVIGIDDKTYIKGDVLFDDNPNAALGKKHNAEWTQIIFDDGYELNKNSPYPYKSNWFNLEKMIDRVLCDKENKIINQGESNPSEDNFIPNGFI